jgi:Type II secretion system (T2SS), protein E, N-terminal domain
MPLLIRRSAQLALPAPPPGQVDRRAGEQAVSPWPLPDPPLAKSRMPGKGLLQSCANPDCNSGWLQVWRSRSAPVFEGGWNCSAECTGQRLQAAVSRELDGRGSSLEKHRHRVPLGLLMLEQGWITSAQLRGALEGQRANRAGRLGHWLMAKEGVSEQLVTRALGLQWSCPVLPLEFHDPEGLSPVLPRLFVDAFGALPLRVAAGKLIYLGFEDRLDPALSLALERMSGLRVESGLVQSSQFRPAHTRMLEAKFPPVELLEAASEPALVRVLTKSIERAKPVESRLVRVRDCLWLRMWRRPQAGALPDVASVEDLVCTIAG